MKPKSPKDGQWQQNEGKSQQYSKATFDILMAKYKDGSADIRGHTNQTIRNTKPQSLVSLGWASMSTVGSSPDKRYRTPPR
jgi:hypothetical protein